ncbi:MAG: response regulator [bacterium]|nr:response regulator [bacterium]
MLCEDFETRKGEHMLRVLVLEDHPSVGDLLRTQFQREPVEVVLAKTAAEARKFFRRDSFDMVALDGIAPSQEGQEPSLVGPGLAREFREMGFRGPIIAISSEPQAQELIKKGADWIVLHKAYACDKLGLVGLVRELQGLYPTSK